MAVSPSRRHARQALRAAYDGQHSTADRLIAAAAGVAHAMLELAFQVGRLVDQTPTYGPPEEQ